MVDEQEVRKNAEDARAGATPHVVRYVLLVSLVAIIVIFAALLLFSQR